MQTIQQFSRDGEMRAYNQNILDVIECARKLMFIADKGDLQREDEGCGVLYAIVRDTAYNLKHHAENEKEAHIRRGIWDDVPQKA
ncbi:MAG: hypothetical protein GF350_00860 [Chitinivibrionales bacterium]|nr:hypothetical protein [Chitinivibrionales bacterium]